LNGDDKFSTSRYKIFIEPKGRERLKSPGNQGRAALAAADWPRTFLDCFDSTPAGDTITPLG